MDSKSPSIVDQTKSHNLVIDYSFFVRLYEKICFICWLLFTFRKPDFVIKREQREREAAEQRRLKAAGLLPLPLPPPPVFDEDDELLCDPSCIGRPLPVRKTRAVRLGLAIKRVASKHLRSMSPAPSSQAAALPIGSRQRPHLSKLRILSRGQSAASPCNAPIAPSPTSARLRSFLPKIQTLARARSGANSLDTSTSHVSSPLSKPALAKLQIASLASRISIASPAGTSAGSPRSPLRFPIRAALPKFTRRKLASHECAVVIPLEGADASSESSVSSRSSIRGDLPKTNVDVAAELTSAMKGSRHFSRQHKRKVAFDI